MIIRGDLQQGREVQLCQRCQGSQWHPKETEFNLLNRETGLHNIRKSDTFTTTRDSSVFEKEE